MIVRNGQALGSVLVSAVPGAARPDPEPEPVAKPEPRKRAPRKKAELKAAEPEVATEATDSDTVNADSVEDVPAPVAAPAKVPAFWPESPSTQED